MALDSSELSTRCMGVRHGSMTAIYRELGNVSSWRQGILAPLQPRTHSFQLTASRITAQITCAPPFV